MTRIEHDFIVRLITLIRTTEMYPPGNATLLRIRNNFMEFFSALIEEERSSYIVLDRMHEHLVINHRLVKPDISSLSQFARFILRMEKLKLVRLVLDAALTEEELDKFLRAFIRDFQTPGETLTLRKLKFPHINTFFGEPGSVESDQVVRVENYFDILAKVIVFHRHCMSSLIEGKKVDVVLIRRMVQELIDAVNILGERSLIVLPAFADDFSLSPHAVCQTILTIRFAGYLGFPSTAMQDLALTALFAMIGRELIPESILEKNTPLTDEEKETLSTIPLLSLEVLLTLKNLSPTGIIRLIASYEMGQPGVSEHPYVRLLKVITDYEAMVSHKPYRLGMHPRQALTVLLNERGEKYDPETVNSFMRFLGEWPSGSTGLAGGKPVVVLDGKTMGVFSDDAWSRMEGRPDEMLPLQRFPVNPAAAIHHVE